jgi:hypothetical protein
MHRCCIGLNLVGVDLQCISYTIHITIFTCSYVYSLTWILKLKQHWQNALLANCTFAKPQDWKNTSLKLKKSKFTKWKIARWNGPSGPPYWDSWSPVFQTWTFSYWDYRDVKPLRNLLVILWHHLTSLAQPLFCTDVAEECDIIDSSQDLVILTWLPTQLIIIATSRWNVQ